MTRHAVAYLLTLVLTLASLSLAHARGTSPDLGQSYDMTVCTGMGMKVLTVDADGQPIESVHLCPDATSIFSASFQLPMIIPPEGRVMGTLAPQATFVTAGRDELTPAARGPPVEI